MALKGNQVAEDSGKDLTIISHGVDKEKENTKTRRQNARERYQEEVRLEQNICRWVDGDKITGLGKFNGDFCVFRPNDREEEIFKRENGVMVPVLAKTVSAEVTNQIAAVGGANYNLKYSDIRTILRRWVDCTKTKRLEQYPQPVGFKSSEYDCFNRLEWDPIPCTFEEMQKHCSTVIAPTLERIITNRDALNIRMGSLCDPQSDRKQAVYLWGDYDAGKSFLFNEILFKLGGGLNGVLSIRPANMKSPHTTQAFIRKTVLIVNECPPDFIDNDDFKALTGDNLMTVNPKNKTIYCAEMRCLIFMASNKAPEIPGDHALKRRIIDCEIISLARDQKMPLPVLREAVKEELPYYMGYCIEQYKDFKAKGLVEIPTNQESLEGHIENHESRMDAIFHKHFSYVPGLEKPTLTLGEFQERVKLDLFQSRIAPEVMRDFVARKYSAHTRQAFYHKGCKSIVKGMANIVFKTNYI